MRLVAPFGFYGAGNIGDESTLQGFAQLAEAYDPRTRAWVASRNAPHTRTVEPRFGYFHALSSDFRRRWAWMTADAMVVAGGTPIQDTLGIWPFNEVLPLIERARVEEKPIAFIGIGAERLHNERSLRAMAEHVAPNVKSWTVRCERDKTRLIEYGVPAAAVTVAADLAWLLTPASRDSGRAQLRELGVNPDQPVVGVNVNFDAYVRTHQPDLPKIVAQLLDEMVRTRNAQVVFVCQEVRDESTFDLFASKEVIALMAHGDRARILPNKYWSPQVMMSLIANCTMTFSTRYHFCLLSALQGVPFMAVNRSDKVSDLCNDLGWPHSFTLGTSSFDLMQTHYEELEALREQRTAQLAARTPALRARAELNRLGLEALQRALDG